jgi:hypothetical protein
MSEEDRMAIFDALGFALTCFPMQTPAADPPEESSA